ncbi:hypothetical protein [Nitrososphaera viennensis]|uniref:Uncharacterized protein n=2 Tax=Nitrososphaera viennensis TaxID=1034015 RepID=A0A060HP41_9ARCH|nr:hypothetical protein [Nitrososphaera viennensis]AIC14942.1 hypothetical protein NVIE_007320 [Nitrososphaera viennensis EN76]UVS69881.1 hypothetical protein NWT39_03615 [Nitrososphaera viennensis]
MTATLEHVQGNSGSMMMTPDEAAFCDYLNASLQSRGLDARFNYVRHKKSGGFDFDLEENIQDGRYLDVFDGLTMSGWLRFLSERSIAFTE